MRDNFIKSTILSHFTQNKNISDAGDEAITNKQYIDELELYKKHMEHDIEEKSRVKNLFDNLIVGIWMKDAITGTVTYVSKGAEDILQYPLQEIYDHPNIWENVIHPADKQEVLKRQEILHDGEMLHHQYRIQCGDGTLKWVADQTVPWFNEDGQLTYLLGMITDITGQIEMQNQLEYLATHDALTSLPNQRSLYEKIDTLCDDDSISEFALLYLDLDRFQLINDSLGYSIGDKLLKKTAVRLLSPLPDDAYIARISSNDFIVVIKNDTSNGAILQLAEHLIETIEKPAIIDGYELHVTTSIGISFYPEDASEKLKLIEAAHAALYRAKQLGKNNYQLYSVSKDITSYKKFVLEKDMRKAIENKEFEIYYQPQVQTSTGIIQGAEALIRWNHSEWGLVSPGEFIPLAEENHLVHHIGEWIIENVCRQLYSWKKLGYTIRPIAVNISPVQFMKKGLVEFVTKQLNRFNIDARYLELEITEGSLLKDEKVVLSTLEGLRKLGVRIAVDDFGTGYSSLMYLREFCPDVLKIDKIFIQNITAADSQDKAITASVLHLARELKLKVVAEGVEEYEQLEFLKQQECDDVQGYLFSKPVPVALFEKQLSTGYLKPAKPNMQTVPEEERRSYYRLVFPTPLLGEMTILKINERQIDLGTASVLIEDISIGGLKVMTSLKMPVNVSIELSFKLILMGETFNLDGKLAWKNEAKGDTFYYGIAFNIPAPEEDRLAGVINKMSVLLNLNHTVPDTLLIDENPHTYLLEHQL